jgi:hypothetical protein
MARYDRIARLDPPPRSNAFGGWLALRDLEGRERDPELARRARARFLALRPARRLLDHGVGVIDAASLDQQVSLAQAEVDRLPEADPERDALGHYLDRVRARDIGTIARACMAVGDICHAAGHGFAAEEFYHTALELATPHAPSMDRVAPREGESDVRERVLQELVAALAGADPAPALEASADAFRGREQVASC